MTPTAMLAAGAPLAVSYGMGVDSTAMLVGLLANGVRPDIILFADTGSEKRETYAYLDTIQAWLARVGFPAVETVRYVPQRSIHGHYDSLEQESLLSGRLPSLAYGWKKCSLKWKRGPQDARIKAWEPAQRAWANGLRVLKAIGYDAGPADSKRAWNLTDDARHVYWYPLRDWGWDRDECKRQIAAAGLSEPMKSACFFCPASKVHEIDWLDDTHPDMGDRIMAIEAAAAPNNTKVEGLWRKAVKGSRGATPRPGSMTEYIEARRRRLTVIQPSAPSAATEGACDTCPGA